MGSFPLNVPATDIDQLKADLKAALELLQQVAIAHEAMNRRLDVLDDIIQRIALGLGVRP